MNPKDMYVGDLETDLLVKEICGWCGKAAPKDDLITVDNGLRICVGCYGPPKAMKEEPCA